MAVELYRQGSTHTRNGIKCEAQIFNEYSFIPLLDAGWFLTPVEVYEEKPIEEEKPIKKIKRGRPRRVKR